MRAATSRDPRRRPPDAGAFLRVSRALRGGLARRRASAVTGAWAGPAAPTAGLAPRSRPVRQAGSDGGPGGPGTRRRAAGRTRWSVPGGPGYGDDGRYDAGPGYGGTACPAAATTGPRGRRRGASGGGATEPFLQRWLFSRRLAYLAGALVAVLGLGGGGWWLTSGRYTPVPVGGQDDG